MSRMSELDIRRRKRGVKSFSPAGARGTIEDAHPRRASSTYAKWVQVLRFMLRFHTEHGYWPSITDIQEAVEISSKSVVYFYLQGMLEVKLVKHDVYVARSWQVTHEGELFLLESGGDGNQKSK